MTEVLRLTVDTSRGATLVALVVIKPETRFIVNEVVGDVWYGTHGLVTNVTGEEKDVSDQPFVCDQFHTGNRLSFYASYSRNQSVISG